MEGHNVKVLQNWLKTKKYLKGAVDGVYGPETARAVKDAKYALGYRTVNNQAGDLILAYLSGKKKPNLAMRARAKSRVKKATKAISKHMKMLQVAISQTGIKESPANSNIVKFSIWYKLIGPWCAMFLSWCASKVGFHFHYAYVPYVLNDARSRRNNLITVSRSEVRPGDFVIYWGGKHIGMFEKWIEPGVTFFAREGNTSAGNDSNGGEVQQRERKLSDVTEFVRCTK
jgi:hypothetical protein